MREDQVRELLGLAGETIEVGPVAEPVEATRRRWPYVAGAAAAAVAIAASMVVGVTMTGDRDAAPPTPAVTLPSPDELPLSSEHYELDDDQVPLLIGWKVEDARRELEARGLEVRTEESSHYGCESLAKRVFRTDPAVGSKFRGGDTITLTIPGPVIDCLSTSLPESDLAWRLIDFAGGRGPLPEEINGDLTLWLGPKFSRTITAEEAQDPANWVVCSDNGVVCASALHDLVENQYFQTGPFRADGSEPRLHPVPPMLEALRMAGSSWHALFPAQKGDVLPDREALRIAWTTSGHGINLTSSVDVFRVDNEPGSRVDSVSVWTGLNIDGTAGVDLPDVTGLFGPEAANVIQESECCWNITVVRINSCNDPGRVLATEPEAGALVRRGSAITVHICQSDSLDPDPAGEAIAHRWLLSIQPDSPISMSPYAERVDLHLGNKLVTTVDGGTLHGADAWEICPPGGSYSEYTCPFSARDTVLAADRDSIVFTGAHPAYGMCAEVFPDEEPPSGRFAVLGLAEPEACLMNWNVELYYDADQRITAVNLLRGSP